MRAVLSLGSNMNAREERILEAVHLLGRISGVTLLSVSSLYETAPVGDGFTSVFINAAAIIETTLSPAELLEQCIELENRAGRKREDMVRDRPLDVDILLYGSRVLAERGLEIPHPRLGERRFVLRPLAEIGPAITVPPGGERVDDLSEKCAAPEWVRRVSGRLRID